MWTGGSRAWRVHCWEEIPLAAHRDGDVADVKILGRRDLRESSSSDF
jgi:hypothetical protein